MRARTRGEEHSHHGTGSCDTQQDTDSTCHPIALPYRFAAHVETVGPGKGNQEPRIKDQDRGALDPSADRIGTHEVRSHARDKAEDEEESFEPFVVCASKEDTGCQ